MTESSRSAGASSADEHSRHVWAATDGLRERKRLATRAKIEDAAIGLSLARGYDNVTVDAICHVAQVSARTLFNYFGTKEGVLLASLAIDPTPDMLAAVVYGSQPIIDDVLDLVAEMFERGDTDPDRFRDRHRIIAQSPELFSAQLSAMARTQHLLVDLMHARLAADQGIEPSDAPEALWGDARMLGAVCGSIMQFAHTELIEGRAMGDMRDALGNARHLHERVLDQYTS